MQKNQSSPGSSSINENAGNGKETEKVTDDNIDVKVDTKDNERVEDQTEKEKKEWAQKKTNEAL